MKILKAVVSLVLSLKGIDRQTDFSTHRHIFIRLGWQIKIFKVKLRWKIKIFSEGFVEQAGKMYPSPVLRF